MQKELPDQIKAIKDSFVKIYMDKIKNGEEYSFLIFPRTKVPKFLKNKYFYYAGESKKGEWIDEES
jgi:hypothetical protein